MLNFNEKDFYIKDIKAASGLADMVTSRRYRVYGLKPEKDIMILIKYNYDAAGGQKLCSILDKPFRDFCDKHNIKWRLDSDYEFNGCSIGIRKDLRENVPACAALLKTLIYIFEEKIVLSDSDKVIVPLAQFILSLKKEIQKEPIKKIEEKRLEKTDNFTVTGEVINSLTTRRVRRRPLAIIEEPEF